LTNNTCIATVRIIIEKRHVKLPLDDRYDFFFPKGRLDFEIVVKIKVVNAGNVTFNRLNVIRQWNMHSNYERKRDGSTARWMRRVVSH